MGLWSPIDTEEKRSRWLFVGGGLAAVVAALWAVFTYLNPPKPDTAPSARNVTATGGGIAVGGNVSGSTINTAPSPPQPTPRINAHTEPKPKTNGRGK